MKTQSKVLLLRSKMPSLPSIYDALSRIFSFLFLYLFLLFISVLPPVIDKEVSST